MNCIPEKPPTENAVYEERISGYLRDKKEIPALRTDETAIPARTSVVPDLLNFPENEIAIIKRVVAKAPKKAPKGIIAHAEGVKHKISITTKPAPEFIPTILGAQRGLFVIHCKISPAAARDAPATVEPKTLGSRMSLIIIFSVSFFPVRPSIICERSKLTLPKEIAAMRTKMNTEAAAIKRIVVFLFFTVLLRLQYV